MRAFYSEIEEFYDTVLTLYDKGHNGDIFLAISDAIIRYLNKVKNGTVEDNAVDIEARQLIRDIHRIFDIPLDKDIERNRAVRNGLGQIIFGILEEIAEKRYNVFKGEIP